MVSFNLGMLWFIMFYKLYVMVSFNLGMLWFIMFYKLYKMKNLKINEEFNLIIGRLNLTCSIFIFIKIIFFLFCALLIFSGMTFILSLMMLIG